MSWLNKIVLTYIIVFLNSLCFAEESYYLTLRNDKVNLRQGPSFDYPVKIVYEKKFLPILVLDKSDNWRKILDHENNSGWIHISQLSKKKAALVIDDNLIMFKNPTIYSKPIAVFKKGRLARIIKCEGKWCKAKSNQYKGWLKKDSLWGLL